MTNVKGAAKVAVVTGAGHGIGKEIADQLAALGHTVHGVDLPQVDLSDSAATNAFFKEIGPVDILVNNAGGVVGQVHQPLENVSDEDWKAVYGANIMATFHCSRAVIPHMKAAQWGRIVTISSGAGRSVSLTGIQAYASAKAAQISFTRQMAYELGPHGVTVNAIAPGFILSNPSSIKQWESYGAEGQKKIIDAISVRRLGEPRDIANAVKFFIAEDSSWVTGQCLSVDGGHSLF
jgi:3-oxoacyl-[acyl-carrier protein] reductase